MRHSEYNANRALSLGAIIKAEQERRRAGLVADTAWFESWRAQQLRAHGPYRELRQVVVQVAVEAAWIIGIASAILTLVGLGG